MRGDDVYGFRRALSESAPSAISYWSDRILVDLVGFRRTADQIVIEAFAAGDLRGDEKFLGQLRIFWESERGLAWRFGVKAGPTSPSEAPNQSSQPSPGRG
jgi:hypothetical protein